MLKQLQFLLKVNKLSIIACLIAMLFIANPFTAKAQPGIGLQVSGAGWGDANGSFKPRDANYGHPTWGRVGLEYSFYIYFNTVQNQWVMQYTNNASYLLVGVAYYCNAYPGNNPDRPVDGGWFLAAGRDSPAPTSQPTTRQIYYNDTDNDGYPNSTSDAKDDYYVTPAPIFSGFVLSTLAKGTYDCNSSDASVWRNVTCYPDNDGDGYGANTAVTKCIGTNLPAGFVYDNTDCNDANAALYRTVLAYADLDRDGYGAGPLISVCIGANLPAGYSYINGDCDAGEPTIYPRPFYVDADGDGFGAGSVVQICRDPTPPTGYSLNNSDCDDTNAAIRPSTFYVDRDGDGFGAGPPYYLCANVNTPPVGYSTNDLDCDDNNATTRPYSFKVDADRDGYSFGGIVTPCATGSNTPPVGYTNINALVDCNDNDATIQVPPVVTTTTTNATPCFGSPTTLTASGAASYTWSDGVTNGVPFASTVTKTYSVTGTTKGCSATTTQMITVKPVPTVTASIINPTFCNSATTVLNFDGVDDYITQPITINGSGGTWQAWVQKADWTDHHNDVLFGNGIDAGNNNSFYLSLHPGVGLHFRYGGAGQAGNNYVSSIVTRSFAPNSWHHLAAAWVWNGSQTILALYVDGVAVANDVAALNLSLSAPSYVGGDAVNPKFGSGSMKEVSLWNVPRAAADIANTYTISTAFPQAGLVSLLNFNNALANELNVNTITDNANGSVSTLNNFTLSGATSNYILQNAPINRTVTLTATGATTYSWTNGITNGVPFLPTATNTYTVIGTAANGCTASTSRLVTVNQSPSLSVTANTTNTCLSSATVLNFDGVDDYIYQPFAINGNSGTWQAWVQKADWTDHHNDVLFGNGIDAGSNNSFYISLHPGVGLHFRYGGAGQAGNNYVSTLITKSFAANSWHHLAAAWYWNGSQTILVLYVDGVAIANNISTLNLALSAPTFIGGDASNPKFGSGSMKDISLWSIPRSPVDIANTYATNTTFPQFGMYSLLSFNSAIANGTNADRATDNANVPSALINFALTGGSSNYISSVIPIIPTPITLTASGASSYRWSNGITNGSPFGLTATKTYMVTGTDANGCINTANQTITVNQPSPITITGATAGCGSVTLTANGGTDYAWSGGSTPSVSSNTFTESGNYRVTATNSNGCLSIANQTVAVATLLVPSIAITANPLTGIIAGMNVTFTATPTNGSGAPQYQWYVNSIAVGPNSPTFSTTALRDNDVVQCVLTAFNPCQTTGVVVSNTLIMKVCPATTVLYVKPTATGTGDGLSWANATNNLQAIANSTCVVTEIWVAKGTYKPSATDRTLSFVVPSGIKMYGGFAGTETSIADRTAITTTNLTTLSGDLNGNDVGFTNNGENSYTVVKFLNASATTLIDGFTIRGANNETGGGGIYNEASGTGNSSNPQINNCVITGNRSSNRGAGLLNNIVTSGTCSPTVTNCVFTGNASFVGGAIYNNGTGGISSPTVTNCSFAGNTASYGGAMYNLGVNGVSSSTLTNCIFFGNGGSNTFSNVNATVTATYCTFDNSVTEYTGSLNLTTTVSPFVSAVAPYNLRISFCSPAFNSGNNSAINLTTDIDGNPRIFNTTVDRGAYEIQIVPTNRLYVDATKTSGSNTGLSWDNAFLDLQSALSYPTCASSIEVWVAGGTYKPSRDVLGNTNPTDNRSKAFLIANANGNQIYGGFAGTETSLAQRTLAVRTANPTILSGDFNNNDGVTGTGETLSISGDTENARHVVVINTPSVSSRFDGFTLTGGSATSNDDIFGIGNSGNLGAGLYITVSSSANITVANCSFSRGRSVAGGGVYLRNGNLTLTNCAFDRNHAGSGGGLYLAGGLSVVSNCVFSGNKSTVTGGGAQTVTGAPSTFTNCTFFGNAAPSNGGGGLMLVGTTLTATNSIFWGNTNSMSSSAATPVANYCVVEGGFGGTGNLSTNPFFSNAVNPIGADGIWFTADDGLNLGCNSSAYNTGTNTNAPTTDILGNAIFGSIKDVGAYESQTALTNITSTVSIAASPSTSIVAGTNVTFTATPTNGGATPQYQWFLNNANVGTNSSTYSNNALQNGDVIACVLTADNICKTTPTVTSNTLTITICLAITKLHVKPTASGTGDGSSWANAMGDLQVALNNICGISQVWVAVGTYKPSRDVSGNTNPTNGRAKTFLVPNGTQIYGGFAGTETTLAQRPIPTSGASGSILSGDFGNNDVTTGTGATLSITNNAENASHVVVINAPSAATLFDGFTVTGGTTAYNNDNLFGLQDAGYFGGGLLIIGNAASVTVANCIVSKNRGSVGGGLYSKGGNLTLTNCVFDRNVGDTGGGSYLIGSSSAMTNCVFSGNQSSGKGGGAEVIAGASHTLTNCTFAGNSASANGGSLSVTNTTATLTNLIIWGNASNSITNSGTTIAVNYSVVEGGYGGTSNLATNPFFSNAANPIGADGIWLTADDGLQLVCGSSAYNAGTNTNAPTTDILGNAVFGSIKDAGAYESPTNILKFVPTATITASPSFSILAGTNVTFTATVTDGGATPQYQWLLNNVNVGTNSLSYSNNAMRDSDVVKFVLTASNICQTASTVTSNVLTIAICPPSTILYVKPTASGTGDGSSWANATNRLQTALNNRCGITEIWVAKGTYTPLTTDRTVSFDMPSGMRLYGGFAGTETSLTARNTVTNLTTLSGDLNSNDVGFTSNGENSYTVVKFRNASAATVIDGFTIRGANNPGGGGGIYNEATGTGNLSNPQINNCIFTGNTTSNRGAGLLNNSLSGGTCSPSLTNCSFVGNRGYVGGGIYNNGAGGVSSPTLTNCSFAGNTADYGAAMYNLGVSGVCSPTLTNCVFFNNDGGNTFSNPLAAVTATYCLFDNTVTDYVGSSNLTTTVSPFMSAVAPFDLRLAPCSIAINAGNNSAINLTTDIEGNPRKNGATDMGAYEFQGSSSVTGIATENQTSTMNVASSGMTYFTNNCNNLILGLTANGSAPVNGMVEGRVWIQTTAPPSFVKRHYQITPSTNPNGASGRVTLYFTQTDLNDFNSSNTTKLPTSGTDAAGIARFRIEKRSGTSSDGTGLPTSYTGAINVINPADADIIWNAPSSRWEVSFDVTGFSGFFAVAQDVVLPVELLDFKANKFNDQVKLNWSTASEKDNAHFDVERSSNGNTFVNIGQVKGFGTKETSQYYSLLDKQPLNGINYYRLKQVNTNGRFAYSKTISIVLSKSNNPLKAHPNPVSDVLTIVTEATGSYEIFNLLGQQILRGLLSAKEIDVSALPEGSYVLKVGEEQVKFVKN